MFGWGSLRCHKLIFFLTQHVQHNIIKYSKDKNRHSMQCKTVPVSCHSDTDQSRVSHDWLQQVSWTYLTLRTITVSHRSKSLLDVVDTADGWQWRRLGHDAVRSRLVVASFSPQQRHRRRLVSQRRHSSDFRQTVWRHFAVDDCSRKRLWIALLTST